MGDPFVCNKCGAPRKYINQFCPECFSTGPHLPAPREKSRPSLPAFKKKPPEKDYCNDDFRPRRRDTNESKHTRSDTFAEEFNYGRPRQEKTWNEKEPRKVKQPKQPKPRAERPPRVEVGVERFEEIFVEDESRPDGKSIFRRPALFIALFSVIVVLIVLLISNSPNSGNNNIAAKPITTADPAQNNKPAATSSNASTSALTPADNSSPPAPVTPAIPIDTTPPKLVGAQPEIITADTSATLAWTTDRKCKSTVKFGTDKSAVFSGPDEIGLKTDHTSFLSPLSPDTLYYYNITAVDEAGNSGLIAEGSFRTDYQSNSAPYVGSRAPDFTLTTLDGNQVSLSQYRGQKVILNFWASWCSPCKIELPHIQEVYEKFRDGDEVTVITVAGSESDENEIRAFIKMKGFTFPVLLDSTESTFNRYNLTSIPKTFFLDKNGVIKKVQLGMFTSAGEIEFMLTSY